MTNRFPICPRTNSAAIEAKYIGSRTGSVTVVVVQTEKRREHLRPRFDLIRHQPVGFDWARTGSRPAQLALALLAHASGDDEFALEHYQVFQHEIISRLPRVGWELTSKQVLQMLRFVSQGTETELMSLQPAPAKTRKTAVIHALLPSRTHNSRITANGSARSVGGAVTVK